MDSGSQPTRPLGISIIAVLAAIAGVFLVLGGLAWFGMGMAGGAVGAMGGRPALGFLGALGAFGGLIMLAWGAVELYAAYGAWNLKPWAWTWLVVLSIIGVVMNLLSLRSGLVGLVISAVILYYLFTPAVKAAFGRS